MPKIPMLKLDLQCGSMKCCLCGGIREWELCLHEWDLSPSGKHLRQPSSLAMCGTGEGPLPDTASVGLLLLNSSGSVSHDILCL